MDVTIETLKLTEKIILTKNTIANTNDRLYESVTEFWGFISTGTWMPSFQITDQTFTRE